MLKLSLWIAVSILAVSFYANALASSLMLDAMPTGYEMQSCDDCGVVTRQPHVVAGGTFFFGAIEGEDSLRTIAFSNPELRMEFTGLLPDASYVIAITYVSEPGAGRVQRLLSGDIVLHDDLVIPEGKGERFLLRVPAKAIRDDKLLLEFKRVQGPNAVVSVVELWTDMPTLQGMHLEHGVGASDVVGKVNDTAWNGIGAVTVELRNALGTTLASTLTSHDGSFGVDADCLTGLAAHEVITIVAVKGDVSIESSALACELRSLDTITRPIPTAIASIRKFEKVLDGEWQLQWPAMSGFHNDGGLHKDWQPFVVPGQWLQQGYDVPKADMVAVETAFSAPRKWKNSRVILRFDSIHARTRYWLNGVMLGMSERLYTPVEFDVTHAIKLGKKNYLALEMVLASTSEDLSHTSTYAHHNLGGIDRSVRLFALPKLSVQSIHIETELDDEYRDAELGIALVLDNVTGSVVNDASIRVHLEDPKGDEVSLEESCFMIDALAQGVTSKKLVLPVAAPARWNAEKPNLYAMTLEIYSGTKFVERIEKQVGFREVAVRGAELLVNGVPITLAGVNRHEIDPLTGRAATVKWAEIDTELFRKANVNYIRTSHYPPTEEFLDACDRLGMYVEVEAPFCWTRNPAEVDNADLLQKFMEPTEVMVEFHRNHPSLIIWSLANESGFDRDDNRLPENYKKALELCHDADPTRPVVFNNAFAMDQGLCDVATLHYQMPPFKHAPHLEQDTRPIIMDEYWHVLTYTPMDIKIDPGRRVKWTGTSNGADSIWNVMRDADKVIGAAIWGGIDDVFLLPGGEVTGYGPWGIIDAWRRKKPEWWLTKLSYSPVWIPTREVAFDEGQNSITIPVENRYSFTDLGELRATWELGDRHGNVAVGLAPLSSGEFEVAIPDDTRPGDLMVLRFYDAAGDLVTAHVVSMGERVAEEIPAPNAGRPAWSENGGMITVEGKDFSLGFDKSNMHIDPSKTSIPLLQFPSLHVTQKERGFVGVITSKYAEYPDMDSREIESVTVTEKVSSVVLTIMDSYDNFKGSIVIELDDEGCGLVTYDYVYSGEAFPAGEVGVEFAMARSCQNLQWRRMSEWGVYPDEHIGRVQGKVEAFPEGMPMSDISDDTDKAWALFGNEMGTNDFRSTKYSIYEAALTDDDGMGVGVLSDGATDVRACMTESGVSFYVKTPFDMNVAAGGRNIAKGEQLSGRFYIKLLKP